MQAVGDLLLLYATEAARTLGDLFAVVLEARDHAIELGEKLAAIVHAKSISRAGIR